MKLKPIRKEDLTRKPIVTAGSRLVETISLNPSDVYIPLSSEGIARNAVRTKIDQEHILAIAASMEKGIDTSEPVPIILKYAKPKVIGGKTYLYELIAGYHRQYAILKNMYVEYVYDVYEFGINGVSSLRSIRTLQLVENDKLPSKTSNMDEVVNTICELIEKNELASDEDSVREYVEEVCSNTHGRTKTAIVNRVLNNTGGYRDITTFTFDQVKAYLSNPDNYDSDQPEYVTKFEGDLARGKKGAVIQSGYENEFIPTAMKHFAKDKSETYFTMHIAPKMFKQDSDINKHRKDMLKSCKAMEDAILKVAEFHKENGRFPWSYEAWLAQDNKNGETKFIPV